MPDRLIRKWRPRLALVIGGTLAAVLLLPIVGIVYLRLWGNVMGWGEAAWLVAWIAFVATAILALLLWRLVLRPVYRLTDHAKALKSGRLDTVAPDHFGTAELFELGNSVLDMGDTLHNRAQGLRAYTDHVTHELKSPLTTIIGSVELLGDATTPQEKTALIAAIGTSAARMEVLLNDLRKQAAAHEPLAPGQSRMAELLPELQGRHAALQIVLDQDGAVPLGQDAALAILTQLCQNAQDHGATEVRLGIDQGQLTVSDNGRGIPPGDRSRIFAPFYTTRRAEGGTGMGLSIVQGIVQSAGGRIALTDSATGASFRISF